MNPRVAKCPLMQYHNNAMQQYSEPKTQDSYYESRYVYDEGRSGVWASLSRFLGRFVPPQSSVLEIGAGYCAFINQVQAAKKHALDVSPAFAKHAAPSVKTHVGSCEDLSAFTAGELDVVFASNLFEHLTDPMLQRTLAEVRRVLKPAGRLILLQPNYRYAYREYFDDYTHVRVFSHVSLVDMLTASGFKAEAVYPRFLPMTMKSRLPKWPWLVSLYLWLPFRPFARQMLVVAVPDTGGNGAAR